MKLRDVTLSYKFPALITQALKVQQINLNFQVSNLMLWKANKFGIDPEFQNTPTASRTMPINQHSFSLGANIVF